MDGVLPVPLETFVVEPVEEVWLGAHSAHIWMHAQKLQQRPGAPFLHANDDSLRKLLTSVRVGNRDATFPAAVVRLRVRVHVSGPSRVPAELRARCVHFTRYVEPHQILSIRDFRRGVAKPTQAVKKIDAKQEHGKRQRHSGQRSARVQPSPANTASHVLR